MIRIIKHTWECNLHEVEMKTHFCAYLCILGFLLEKK